MRVFIDSNIPMYVSGGEHPHRAASVKLLEGVQSGAVQGCTSTEVLQEILYRYSALKRLDMARRVYDLFVQVCPVVFDVTLADTDRARDLLMDTPAQRTPSTRATDLQHVPGLLGARVSRLRGLLMDAQGISARDALHAAVMMNNKVEWIATFDKGFDGVPGIQRMVL